MDARSKSFLAGGLLPGATLKQRPAGFTLLEVIAATVVLAVGLAVVIESISLSLSGAAVVERSCTAHNLAADKLNRACAGDLPSLPNKGQEGLGGASYDWCIEETEEDAKGLRTVICTVSWKSRGQQRTVTVRRRQPSNPGVKEGP